MSTGAHLLVEVGEALYGASWPAALARKLPYSESYFRGLAAGVDQPLNIELGNELRRLVLREHYVADANGDPTARQRKEMFAALAHRLMLPDWRLEGETEPAPPGQ